MQQSANNDNKAVENQKRFVLVVDSNTNELNYTIMLLQRLEYEVCTANSAEEAVDFMSVALPDIIISDVALDGKSGVSLISEMKHSSRMSPVPVILVSSSPDQAIEKHCRDAGCAGFVRKPLDADELYRAVQAAMEPTPRKTVRIGAYLTVDLTGAQGGGTLHPVVLSENGMFIRTTDTKPIDTRLPISVMIRNRKMNINASVIYSYGFGDYPFKEPGMGLKFEKIGPEDKDLIRTFIVQQLEQGIVEET
ncbi:MAG TPA: hypothetical protein DCO77_05070 [Nitrospiraceae bacterium]|nr:hypothetical protein [Nitrospiraceae bacterium]